MLTGQVRPRGKREAAEQGDEADEAGATRWSFAAYPQCSAYILECDEAGTRMAIRVVQLGSPRARGEGLRLGTVRRPPRGVPKAEHASRDFYDVWLPDLAPSEGLVKQALSASAAPAWRIFARRYRAEMKRPEAQRLLGLLAALSRGTNLSVGCYCTEEARCHRSVLRALLLEHGADVA